MAVATVLALEEETMGEEVVLVINEETILVRSKSEVGTWHAVQMWDGRPCACSCPGAHFRGTCRHIKAVESHVRQSCERCDKPTHNHFAGRVICALCALNAD